MRSLLLSALVVVFVTGPASQAEAASISVPSFSFESPDILDQTNTNSTPAGWTFFDSTGAFGAISIFDPSNGLYSNTTGLALPLPGTAEGYQYASLNNAAGGIAGLWSLTTGTLAVVADNMTYTLTVALGNSKASNPFEFTHLDLLVNGAQIATTAIGRGAIPQDTFTDFSASFTTGAGDALSGGNLAIRIRATESAFGVIGFSDFDNVRLNDSTVPGRQPIPEPTTMSLLALGGAVSWTARRRRLRRQE